MRSLLAASFAFVTLTTLTTACGDDPENDTGASSSEVVDGTEQDTGLSKEQYITQGDALCRELSEAGDEVEPPESPKDFARFLEDQLELGTDAVDEFEALEPPADGQDVHTALLDSYRSSLESIEGAVTAAKDGDTVTAEDLLSQASEQGDAADEEAQEYGFEECGKDPGAEG